MQARHVACAVFAITFAIDATAFADDKEACLRAAERTQELKDARRLLEARAAARACEADTCPAVARSDCAKWLEEIEAALPTIVVRAEDATGSDRVDVEVLVDGKSITKRLDGSAIPLDPGQHHVVYRAPGAGEVAQDLLLAQGEKNRRVLVRLEGRADTTSNEGPRSGRGPWPWVLGGVAVVALGSFAFFGARALSKKDDIESSCASTHSCTQSQKDALFTSALVADVSLGVAVVAGGLATWLFLRTPSGDVTVAPSTSGAVARWRVAF